MKGFSVVSAVAEKKVRPGPRRCAKVGLGLMANRMEPVFDENDALGGDQFEIERSAFAANQPIRSSVGELHHPGSPVGSGPGVLLLTVNSGYCSAVGTTRRQSASQVLNIISRSV